MSAPTIDADPFATPEDTRQQKRDRIISGGRYRLPTRDGEHKPYGWQRMTNLVGAFSDQKQLQKWDMRTTLAGLAQEGGLYAELRAIIMTAGTTPEQIKAAQEQILDVAERAKDAAGGGRGRERGNRIHVLVEADHRDLPYVPTTLEHILLKLYRQALADAGLRAVKGMQERIVLLEQYEAVGTLDNVLEDLTSGCFHIGDLKTQKRFWTWLEVEAQLSGYAHSVAVWDAERGMWVDWPVKVDRTRGAVMWCPEPESTPDGQPTVQVRAVDLERGWRTLQLAHEIVKARSAAGRTRQDVSGHTWTPVRPIATVERYAALLLSAETMEEGSRVVREAYAAGVWCLELGQVAARRVAELRAL